MTAPAADATWTDVQSRWPGRGPLTTEEQATATIRIADAYALLRQLVPDLADRASRDPNLAAVVVSRVADAVVRYMENPSGARQLQEAIGPRSWGATFDSGRPVGIFFTDDELVALRPSAASTAGTVLGTAFAKTRPGWAPTSPGWGSWPTG